MKLLPVVEAMVRETAQDSRGHGLHDNSRDPEGDNEMERDE